MNLSDLSSPFGARTRRKRIGRGHGSGHEKTAGFGQKGQKARTGHHKSARHKMGGQTPIQMQLPYKRGFKNLFRLHYYELSLDQLAGLSPDTVVTPEVLVEEGILRDRTQPIVILAGSADLALPALTVHAHRVSKSAQATIEAAGGSVQLLDRSDYESTIQPGRPGGPPAVQTSRKTPIVER
jgi:large subunit ribosomal protein L15